MRPAGRMKINTEWNELEYAKQWVVRPQLVAGIQTTRLESHRGFLAESFQLNPM
jgi:hypothetical protein